MNDEPSLVRPTTAPPGWYSDGYGLRWWDGRSWGPYAPPQPQNWAARGPDASASRTWAILSHLGILLGGFVLPLVVRLTDGERNEFSRHHSTEALNMNITFTIVWVGSFIVAFALAALTHGVGFLIVLPVVLVLYPVTLIWSIRGAIKANRGEWWTYPLTFRFVKGARPKGSGPQ